MHTHTTPQLTILFLSSTHGYANRPEQLQRTSIARFVIVSNGEIGILIALNVVGRAVLELGAEVTSNTKAEAKYTMHAFHTPFSINESGPQTSKGQT
jgi:hypothetical protein